MIIWIPSDPNSEILFVDSSDLDKASKLLLSAGFPFFNDSEVGLRN